MKLGLAVAKAALVLGAAVLGTGCVTQKSGAVAEQPMWRNRPSYALSVVDRREVTALTHVVGEFYEKGQPAIDAAHQRVFVGSSDRHLYALSATDLRTLWSFKTLGFVQCEPLYDPVEDVVYFGSHDGALYKVKASDGSLLWRFNTNSEVNRRPLLYKGLLFAVNANDTIVAVDPASGALKWSYHRTPALGMEIAGYAGVAGGFGRVYTGFSDGRVVSLDALTGEERWWLDLAAEAEQASGEVPRYLDVDATPIVTRTSTANVVFVAGFAAGMFALDAETGSRLWGNEQASGVTEMTLWEEPAHKPRDGGPIVPSKRLLIGASGNTGLWALRLDDGRDIWRKALPEGGVSGPTPYAGGLLVGTTRYGLFFLNALDGGVIDAIDTGSGFAMQPAAYGRRAFVMTNQGSMLSLHIDAPRLGRLFAEATTRTLGLYNGVQLLASGRPPRRKIGLNAPNAPRAYVVDLRARCGAFERRPRSSLSRRHVVLAGVADRASASRSAGPPRREQASAGGSIFRRGGRRVATGLAGAKPERTGGRLGEKATRQCA